MSSLRNHYARVANPVRTPFIRLGTDTGIPTGESNMVGNYSAAPKLFWVQPDPGQILGIEVLHVILSDNGNPSWSDYGNLSAGLTNGLRIFLDVEGVIVYGRSLIKNNADIATQASQESFINFANNTRLVSYAKPYVLFSAGFRVELNSNILRFGFELNDDFTGLLRHQFVIDGYQQVATG